MENKRKLLTYKKEANFVPCFLSIKEYEANTTNGLYFNNTYIPEEIVFYILTFIDPHILLNYTLVCRKWNKLIKSYSLWATIYERKYNRKAKKLPWYLYCYLLSTSYFDNNLLVNGNGEDGLNNWQCKLWEGDKYIEEIPIGSDSLPENIPEFNNQTSCFVTSYFAGYKAQIIKFGKSKLFRYIINNYKPHIYLSEWVTGRFDCACEYVLQCGFIGTNLLKTPYIKPLVTYFKTQWEEPRWKKVELIITEYPEKVEGVTFENNGHNLQVWKGHYGIKMAGGVVKLLFDSIESLPINKHGDIQSKKFTTIQFLTNELPHNDSQAEGDIWNGEYDDEIYYYMP